MSDLTISKHSSITLGLGVIVGIILFWVGFSYATVSTKVAIMEKRLESIEVQLVEINKNLK